MASEVGSLGLVGSGSATTAATTLVVTNTRGTVIPAGTLIHITGCWDNIASVTAPTITCSTVGGGTAIANHATAIGSGVTTTAGAGIWHQCFRVLTTADIAIGATIATLTSNQSAVKRAAHAQGWTGVDTTLRGTVATGVSTTGSPTVTTTGTALVYGDLVIGSVSFENNAQMTGDADVSIGNWDPIVGTFTTGGAAGTNVGTGSQSKVLIGTTAQTYNPTGGVADTVACVYSVVPMADPTFTQASYRFYADGTEAGSTALGTQDTSYTADTSGGDASLLLRTRLQSTSAIPIYGTDDFQLQWEKNANGKWAAVGATLCDGYDESNFTGYTTLQTLNAAIGQTFLGDGQALTKAGFYLHRVGASSGNLTAYLWAHTGTYGVDGVGTGPILATSTPKPANALPTNPRWEDFTFDGTFTLAAGTPYVIGIMPDTAGNANNQTEIGLDNTGAHGGNLVSRNASSVWGLNAAFDTLFRVYTVPTPVAVFNSANLTEGAATTNRLGAGTGSFTAGKVAEDGLVDDLGWPTSNYTELLYALTVKQAGVAHGDTLRFRVLRNNMTTGLTYTQVPTVSVSNVPAAVTQASYRFYEDFLEGSSLALAAQDTAYAADLGLGDVSLQLRTRMQSTNSTAPASTDDWQLQWEKNASGTWTNVVTGGSTVAGDGASFLSEGAATTNRLGAGTGSFTAGKSSKDGLVDNLGFPGNNYTELLYALSLKAADLAHNDTLRFRVVKNGVATDLTYTAIPTVSVVLVPTAPTTRNLSLTTVTSTTARFFWNSDAAARPAPTYLVEQSTDGTNFTASTVTAVGLTSATVTGLAAPTLYWFRVTGSNASGSAGSNVVGPVTLASLNWKNAIEGTPGAKVDSTNSASGGDPFSFSTGNAAACSYDNTRSHTGTVSMKLFTSAAATTAYAAWAWNTFGVSPLYGYRVAAYWRGYLYLTAYPASDLRTVYSASDKVMILTSTGTVKFNAAGTPSTASVALNQWVRIEGLIRTGTTQSQIRIFNDPESTTPTETVVGTSASSTDQGSVYFGTDQNTPSGSTFWWDDIAVSDVDWIGPLVVPGTRTGRPKVWTGSAFANKPAKVWTGSAWVEKPVKVWSGTAWVLAK
jgi:hypothetical protein